MTAVASIAIVSGAGPSRPVPIVAVDFGLCAEPLPLDDQLREVQIKIEGLKAEEAMLRFAQTGDACCKRRAQDHRANMYSLIDARPERVRVRMAAERGLPHA